MGNVGRKGKLRTFLMQSKLLDMRYCSKQHFKQIHEEMLNISLLHQPWWFRPLLKRSPYLQGLINYNHWSRAWEYPWAVLASEMQNNSYKILDVGGGGSPFAIYLAEHGHDSIVCDPSLNQGLNAILNRNKGIYMNIRPFIFQLILKLTGIVSMWGKPSRSKNDSVLYCPYSAEDIRFPDNYFDRVFCLSTMEHIPVENWGQCMKEFERVLKPGGRLIITLDMSTPNANDRQYLKLVNSCSLKLVGDPNYTVPISQEDKEARHLGYSYETIGLVWHG